MLVAVVLLLAAVPRPGAAQSTTYGDYVRAARLLNEWSFEESAEFIDRLVESHPKAGETRYLQAELSFVTGDYPRALEHLEGLADSAVGQRVGLLRNLVSSTLDVTQGFAKMMSQSGHFAIHYAPGNDELLAELAGDVLDAAYQRIGEDFDFHPSEVIRVEILGKPSDLARVSTLTEAEISTTGTIALCKYGKLMLVSPRATLFGYPWMDTLTHEYVHYLVARKSRDRVPVWLQEGLARFEQTRWRAPPGGALTAIDKHLLAEALKKRGLIGFKAMHPSMAMLPSQEAAALAFAEVFTMVRYLHDSVGYAGLRQMLTLTRGGMSAERAAAEVMNTSFRKLERSWEAYLGKQDFTTSKALAGRAKSRRVRFNKGGEVDDNLGVDEVASKQARKYARLAGILRARSMSAAAAIEYEKALAITGEGDPFVAAKLSRTYLELKEYERAIALATPLALADEDDASPLTTLGVAHAATGNNEAARTAFESALRISPFDPAIRCGLADIYQRAKLPKLAEREAAACHRLRR